MLSSSWAPRTRRKPSSNAFDELDNELERWAVCFEDLTFHQATE